VAGYTKDNYALNGTPVPVNQAAPQYGTVSGNIVYINGVPHSTTQPVGQMQSSVAYNGVPTTAYATIKPGQQAHMMQQPGVAPNTLNTNANQQASFGQLNTASKQVIVTLNGQPVDPNICRTDGQYHQWNTEYSTEGIMAAICIPILGFFYCMNSAHERCIKCQAIKKQV
jgi:hypothetical protein